MSRPPTWRETRPAATAIARYAAGDETLERELRDMCGLIAPDGTIPPDDTAVYVLHDVGKAPGAQNPDAPAPRAFAEHGRRPDGMTTPAGLATLQPVVVPEPSKPLPPHGTRRRFRLEKVAGNVCQPCRDADNAYSSMRQRAQRAAKKKAREASA